METYHLIPILFLLVLVCILGNAYFENTNEINRLSDALRRSSINDFKAKDRQRLEDIIEQKNLEINELKRELTKVKFDYACEVAGGRRGKPADPRGIDIVLPTTEQVVEAQQKIIGIKGKQDRKIVKAKYVGCSTCEGTGTYEADECPNCDGKGATQK